MTSRERIAEIVASLAAGLLFGAGLVVSGMANPAKVLGFLDLFGAWDPSLALVMAGAVGVGLVGFASAPRQARSALGLPMRLPAQAGIDRRLVLGAAVFGVGWGLAGFCPGPALVALTTGSPKAILFVGAMLAGMAGFNARGRSSRSSGGGSSADAA
jgi:uncharacterized membrane protein YedE/YeeE